MVRLHRPQPAPATAGLPAHQRNADRPQRVAKSLITAARRGPDMATVVEAELTGLGAVQLRTVVALLWAELACKDSRNA